MNWFSLSLVGWIIFIVAIAIAAHLMGAPTLWIAIGALALIGIAIIVSANRQSAGGQPPQR